MFSSYEIKGLTFKPLFHDMHNPVYNLDYAWALFVFRVGGVKKARRESLSQANVDWQNTFSNRSCLLSDISWPTPWFFLILTTTILYLFHCFDVDVTRIIKYKSM